MKNLHVLKTDKPSRLLKDLVDGTYQFKKEVLYGNRFELPLNIYITSDEEIKEGVNQWYLDKFLNKPRNSGGSQYGEKQNVIILTTDQDLIKDGVQAIDDEFLEWFVKNPKSENVYVYKKYKQVNQNNPVTRGSTALGFSHYAVQSLDLSAPIGTNEKEIMTNLPNSDDFFKQETIEEFIQRQLSLGKYQDQEIAIKYSILAGAKWQQEQMYSEEEVIYLLYSLKNYLGFGEEVKEQEWFKQFKKK